MAGHEDPDCTYQDMNRNSNDELGYISTDQLESQIYEDMQEGENPAEDTEDRFYEPVESQSEDAPPVPIRGNNFFSYLKES